MSIAIDTRASTPAAVAVRQPDLEDIAKLLLRVSLGLLMLFHGVAKINNGIDPILGAVAQAGFPAALAYGVYVGEVVAPLLLIVGVWTRAAAIVVAVNMLVAVALVHLKDLAAGPSNCRPSTSSARWRWSCSVPAVLPPAASTTAEPLVFGNEQTSGSTLV
jgi:uncharacterized membrane protein YphA (DoxX/SURF4 family)